MLEIRCKLLKTLVGAERFELPTPCSQSRCATRLRHAPTGEFLPIIASDPAWAASTSVPEAAAQTARSSTNPT